MALGNEVAIANDPEEKAPAADEAAEVVPSAEPTEESSNESTVTVVTEEEEKEVVPPAEPAEESSSESTVTVVTEEEKETEAETEEKAEDEPEAEEEEEEEEELVDPMDTVKEECKAKSAIQALEEKLNECTERVQNNPDTEEECSMELFDYIHAVDHCVAHNLFNKLK